MVLIYYEQLTCNWNFIYKLGEITLKINVERIILWKLNLYYQYMLNSEFIIIISPPMIKDMIQHIFLVVILHPGFRVSDGRNNMVELMTYFDWFYYLTRVVNWQSSWN